MTEAFINHGRDKLTCRYCGETVLPGETHYCEDKLEGLNQPSTESFENKIKEMMKSPAAAINSKGDRILMVFQMLNCTSCKFADEKKVWTCLPCCRCASVIKIENHFCKTREPIRSPGEPATPKK